MRIYRAKFDTTATGTVIIQNSDTDYIQYRGGADRAGVGGDGAGVEAHGAARPVGQRAA